MSVLGYLSLLVVWAAVSAAGLIASLVLTSPTTVGPLGVTVWFVGLFLSLSASFTLLLYAVKYFLHLHATGAARLRYAWRQGLLLGAWCTGLLSLSSLDQLGGLDAILLALLLLIVEVYVRFRWP